MVVGGLNEMMYVKCWMQCLHISGAQEMPALPSSSCAQSYSPHSSASSPSFALEGENQSSGLGCLGLARSHVSPLAWQLRKGASWERGIWLRLRWGMQPGLGVFSQALLGRLLKVTPTSNKKSFRHKESLNLASARSGLAFEFRNPSPWCSPTG